MLICFCFVARYQWHSWHLWGVQDWVSIAMCVCVCVWVCVCVYVSVCVHVCMCVCVCLCVCEWLCVWVSVLWYTWENVSILWSVFGQVWQNPLDGHCKYDKRQILHCGNWLFHSTFINLDRISVFMKGKRERSSMMSALFKGDNKVYFPSLKRSQMNVCSPCATVFF